VNQFDFIVTSGSGESTEGYSAG